MSIPGSASPLFFQTAGAAAALELQKSVRFNSGDSAYLNRTPSSAGSNTTWTLSTWVKKTGNDNHIFGAGAGNTPGRFGFGFNGSDKIFAFVIASGSTVFSITTDAVFRDSSAWYHIVVIADTTNGTQADRFKIYVNGVLQSVSGTLMPSSQNTFVNTTAAHTFGRRSYTASDYFNGYLASTILVDGSAKDETDFGAFDDNGVWQAAAYSGSFGTNGFHLFDFENESGIGDDSSGNDNDFTVNNLVSDQGTAGVSRIWSSGDSAWSITGSGRYATKSSSGSYADVFTNLLSPGTLYGFTVDIPDGDDNGGWFFGDSNSTSLSGTHPNQGRGSNSIGMRGRTSGHSDEGEVGVHGTFASANGVSASNNALTGFESVNPEGAISLDFVVDRGNHKVWVKPSSSSNWVKGGNPADGSSTPSFSIPSTGDIYFGFIQYDAQTNLDITQFSITQGADAGVDVLRDVPTNGDSSDDTGAGGEVSGCYATFNALNHNTHSAYYTLSNGNLKCVAVGGSSKSSGSRGFCVSTIGMSSGKYYFELTVDLDDNNDHAVGIATAAGTGYYSTAGNWTYAASGNKFANSGSAASYGASYGDGDTIGVAFDADTGALVFYKNGSSQGTLATVTTGETYFFVWGTDAGSAQDYEVTANFGQRSWAYSAPSGYKALCTTNLPTPTIADGSAHFDIKTWTGNASSSRAITGLNMSPDLLWFKKRNAAYDHYFFDSVRGNTKELKPNTTDAEGTTGNKLISFDSNGFTVGNATAVNASSDTYVGWAWDAGSSTVSNTDGDITSQVRASQTTGFSIVSYTGSGTSNDSVGHGLNAAPELIITKNRDNGTYSWRVLTTAIDGSLDRLFLDANTTKADQTGVNVPTSSVFYVGSNLDHNKSGDGIIAYCISSVAGYSAVNSYSGNGNAEGPFVFTNFRPRWVMIKRTDSTNNWVIYDTARDTYNIGGRRLYSDLSDSENQNTSHYIDILSNGFKVRSDAGNLLNASSGTYLYVAFSENPFQANGGLAR